MTKTKGKRRVKIKTGYINIEECAPTLDKENYVEFLRDLYEKPTDNNTGRDQPKNPGDQYGAYLDELKDNDKQVSPTIINKPPPVKRPKWKGSGINIVKRENQTEPKYPSSVDYLEYKLQKEAAWFSEASESQLEKAKPKEDFTMSGQLFKAVADGRFLQVKTLLKCGVKISSTNKDGHGVLVAALHIEDSQHRESMFKYLLKRDADLMAIDHQQTGRSVLAWACCLNRVEQVAKILQLCQGDIDFSQKDKSGKTVLHHAVVAGNTSVVKMLVTTMKNYGLSVDIPDELGLTPFLYSKKLGYSDIGNVLLSEGRASRKQFDSTLYRSGTIWFEDGQKQRQKEQARLKRVEKEWYKMNGRRPVLRSVEPNGLPTLKLGGTTRTQGSRVDDSEEVDSGSKAISVGSAPSLSALHPSSDVRVSKASDQRNTPDLDNSVPNKTNVNISRSTLYTNSSVANSRISVQSDRPEKVRRGSVYRPPAPVSGGYDPALALLAQVDKGNRVDNFVGSVTMPVQNPAPSQALGNATVHAEVKHPTQQIHPPHDRGINSMFTVLSEQKSRAFRSSVVQQPRPPTPEVEPVRPKNHRKTGVSSLAIIMGRTDGSRKTSRRKRSAKGKSPAAKTSPVNGPSRKISRVSRVSPGVSPNIKDKQGKPTEFHERRRVQVVQAQGVRQSKMENDFDVPTISV